MTVTTIQKIIKVGTSAGVTIPAKTLRSLNLKPGDEVSLTFKRLEEPTNEAMLNYDKFKQQYGQALKNLAGR